MFEIKNIQPKFLTGFMVAYYYMLCKGSELDPLYIIIVSIFMQIKLPFQFYNNYIGVNKKWILCMHV